MDAAGFLTDLERKPEVLDALAQVAEDAEKYFKNLVYKTTIPRNIRLSEAPSFGQPILLYDATSTGARSYFDLAREIMAAHVTDSARL